MTPFEVLVFASGWIIRIVMVPVVAHRHRVADALGWLALILAVPWIGLPAYLVFGEYHLRRTVRGHAKVREDIDRRTILREHCEEVEAPVEPDDKALRAVVESLAGGLGGFPAMGGNRVELLTDADDAVDRLIADIDAARETVHLLFFIFNDDATGRRVAEALARASERGVSCRLLVDPIGSGRAVASRSFFIEMEGWLQSKGVEVHEVLSIRLIRKPLARFDIRNHRKIVVIDGRIGYTGSLNIHDSDFELDDGVWYQTTVRACGPAVLQLQLLFVEDWRFATGELLGDGGIFPKQKEHGEVVADAIPGGPSYDADLIQHVFVAAIDSARERLIATTPYFVPDEPLLLALRLAALRGVEVRLIVPAESDRRSADLAARAAFPELIEAGAHIHLHSGGILHAKSLTVDDRVAVIGSANLDHRSMFLNYELNLVVYDRDFTRDLVRYQRTRLEESRELPDDWWESLTAYQRRVYEVAKLAGPLL